MALAKDPALLILDEPTTGLDATVEAEVLDLVAAAPGGARHRGPLHQPQPRRDREDVRPRRRALRRPARRGGRRRDGARRTRAIRTRSACCAASRAAACARITGGSTRSRASCRSSAPSCRAACSPTAARSRTSAAATRSRRCERARRRPRQPLLLPRAGADAAARRASPTSSCPSSTARRPPLVAFDDLGKVFQQHGHDVHALVDVSRAIWPGETLGLVGESGSGKTTLARTLLGIVEPTTGAVDARRAARSRRASRSGRATTCGRSRSSSRTRTRRSTGATRCGASCAAR